MSPPIPMSEAEAREFAQAIAQKSYRELRRADCAVLSVTVTVTLTSGRDIAAIASGGANEAPV